MPRRTRWISLDVSAARRFVDMPLQWYHGGVSVDRAAVADALVALAAGAPEAAESHHQLGERAGADWHARRIAYFVCHPERIRGVRMYLAPDGLARIDDGRHRYAAALYLGLPRIPRCRVIGGGAKRYFGLATPGRPQAGRKA